MSDIFKNLYAQLNPRQKEAVDTLEGPVMVVAGPGTGKTQILTLRIANILIQSEAKPGTIRCPAKPEEILALTFTESGVAAMRKRLVDILGPTAYYIPIYTFHAFCNELIQNNPDEFPQFFEKNLVDEIAQIQLVEKVIEEGNFNLLKPFGDNFMYTVPLLRTFSDMKREGIGPEKLHNLVNGEAKQFESVEDLHHESGPHKGKMKGKYKDLERNIQKNKEMAQIYTIYQEKLGEIGYDYDDIILSVVERLSGEESFVQGLQEQYNYLLADEHQDTNHSQNKVLELLCAHNNNPNIFVVGDEKQSIYRFQGANLANFIYFHSRYPAAKIITLKENYRSTQSILDASGSVIENNSQGLSSILPDTRTALQAKSDHADKKLKIYSFQGPDLEYYFLARKVKKLIKNGVDAKEIAILYRDNRDAFPIRDMLQKNGVSYKIESDEQLLETEDIKNLFLILQAAVGFGADEALARVMHVDFLHIRQLDIYKLLQRRNYSLHDTVRSKNRMRALGISKALRIYNFFKKLSSWSGLIHNKSAPQVFEIIVRESGFLNSTLKQKDYIDGVNRIRSLHQLAKRLSAENQNYTLRDFVRHLELIQERGISLREKTSAVKRSAVRLMTAHRAKGLEFDYVFIAGVNMGHWGRRHVRRLLKPPSLAGSESHIQEQDKEDDERRLFYVSLTRARKQVYISYPVSRDDGRQLFPSQFIEEISNSYKTPGNSEVYERSLERRPEIFFVNRKDVRFKEDEREFLREVFEKRGLSPTALNNYIECPWKYFYNNLLQIPRAKTKHEMYGTAVHAALKDLFDSINSVSAKIGKAGPGPAQAAQKQDQVLLLQRFERALEREPISDHDFQEAILKGKETLSKYYEKYGETWHTNTINEFAVKNVFLDGEVRLTGKIDKIELLGGNKVNVVDYKTGKRKTRNELEGKTKNAKGNEKRQLVFYKLLLDKLAANRTGSDPVRLRGQTPMDFVMTSGEIDFVEPEKKTEKFYKERFEISDEDVRQLEYKIQDVTAEILGFSFWDKRCEDKNCEYCKLREMIR